MSAHLPVRVYNINKAVGLASSGVEYAQRYRREIFADIEWVEDYYVFTDYLPTNVSVYTDRLGFRREQVVWIYNLLSGRRTVPCTVSVEQFIATIEQPHGDPQTGPGHIVVALTGSPVHYRITTVSDRFVDRVETVVGDQLVRAEHYDETLNNVEHFHGNRLARRVFYTPDGRVAAEQLYKEREITRTLITPASPLFPGVVYRDHPGTGSFRGHVLLDGRSRFFQFVFKQLFSEPDDVVIVDRAIDVIDGIYPVIGDHRLYSVVHAEHFDLKQIEDGVLLWNNHYENVFTRPDLVDGMIVSTRRQQEVLARQLRSRVSAGEIPVTCIPVGFVKEPVASARYERHALVTAGRLADEKHLDVLIRAVSVARKSVPDLRLDIYGGGDNAPLIAVIEAEQAQDYVRLMGHQQLDGVLGGYGLYVSASRSEGFGLSLLEALAEGLPIVGFDVDYGNREMVDPGLNGRLVPFTNSVRDVEALAGAIVDALSSGSLDEMRRHSLRKAEAYSAANVSKLWQRFLLEEEPS